jgi:hypothetical protein
MYDNNKRTKQCGKKRKKPKTAKMQKTENDCYRNEYAKKKVLFFVSYNVKSAVATPHTHKLHARSHEAERASENRIRVLFSFCFHFASLSPVGHPLTHSLTHTRTLTPINTFVIHSTCVGVDELRHTHKHQRNVYTSECGLPVVATAALTCAYAHG